MSSDQEFGPKLASAFDFTLTFDHSILNILPSGILILVTPVFVSYYSQEREVIHLGTLLWNKLGLASTLFGVNIGSLVLWSASGVLRSGLSIASAAVTCVASVGLIACLYYDHRYTMRSSAFITVWLTLSILFDGTTARSYFMRPDYHAVGALTVTAAVLKLVIMILQEIPKKDIIRDPDTGRPVGREAASGFWNRTLYLWLNKTFYTGFRVLLQMEDLDELGPEFSSEYLAGKFNTAWPRANQTANHRLALTCMRILSLPTLSIIVPRLCFSVCLFAQPFFLQAVIRTVETRGPGNQKHFLVVAAALIYFGIATSRSLYEHMTYRLATLLRGLLVGAIITKTLVLPYAAQERAAAVTRMSTDIQLVVGGVSMLHETWIRPLELGAGIYLLSRVVGRASFLVVFPTIASTIATYYLGKFFPTAKATWNQVIEVRVAKTLLILSQIKAIKMAGLEGAVSEELHSMRKVEIQKSIKTRLLGALYNIAGVFCYAFTPPIVIAGALFWTTFYGKLTTTGAFTTLAIIGLVVQPLGAIMEAAPTVLSSLAGFQRIQQFLLLEEIHLETVLENDELQAPADETDKEVPQRNAIEPHTAETANEKRLPEGYVARFYRASITPQNSFDEFALHDLNLAISEGEFVIVSGPTGCGKSVFLRALLHEAQIVAGSAIVELGPKAYCDQTPWIQNTSIRNNIIGYEEFDEAWYNTVLDGCLLRRDLQSLPNGDLTLAGSNGMALSGGQKQRIAAARAAYLRKKIYVLDDIFSALDSATAMDMFTRLLGDNGLLRRPGITVILATNSLQFFEAADRMLVIDKEGYSRVQTDISDPSFQSQVRKLLSEDEELNQQLQRGRSVIDENELVPEAAVDNLVGEDEDILAMRQRGDVGLYWFFAKSIGMIRSFISLILSMFLAFGEKFPDVYIRIWLDHAPEDDTYFVGYVMTSVFACLATVALFGFWYHQAIPASLESLHTLLLNAVMRAKLSYLTTTDHGVLLNFFSQDLTLVSQDFPVDMQRLMYYIFFMAASLGIILSGVQYTAIIVPFVLVTLYAVQHYYLRTSRQVRHMDIESKAPLYAFLTETANGLLHIRAFGWQKQSLADGLNRLDSSQKPFYHMFTIQRWLTLAMDLIVLSIAMILVPIALNVESSSTANSIALSLITLIYFSDSLSGLIMYWTLVETGLGALARIRNLVQTTPQEPQHDGEVGPDWPENGHLEIINVSAKYSNVGNNPRVLKGVSVDIPPGDRVGIVGRTGSGKSSLLLAVLNFLDYTGSIIIDGIDISTVSPQLLRSRIITITQDSIDLNRIMLFNICPWAIGLSDDEMDALEVVVAEVLWDLDMWTTVERVGGLHALPMPDSLSKGQEQLLGIARGLVRQHSTGAKLILMDEPTSNLDSATDANVRQVFDRRLNGCTIITVAHRVQSIAKANTIYQVDDGRISARTERVQILAPAPEEDREHDSDGSDGSDDSDDSDNSQPNANAGPNPRWNPDEHRYIGHAGPYVSSDDAARVLTTFEKFSLPRHIRRGIQLQQLARKREVEEGRAPLDENGRPMTPGTWSRTRCIARFQGIRLRAAPGRAQLFRRAKRRNQR